MLALITQSGVKRPWIQLGKRTVVHFPLQRIEEPKCIEEPKIKYYVESRKQKRSKIPRLIRPLYRKQTKEEQKSDDSDMVTDSTSGSNIQSSVGSSTHVATISPVVRSTRTSQCRMELAHPEWSTVRKRKPSNIPEPQRLVPTSMKRKMIRKHKWQHSPPMIDDPLTNNGGPKQMLLFLCSDQKQINVPCHLINRYSSLMCDRQKEKNFCFNRPIQLESISSITLLQLVQWMQQHCHDDLKQLQKASPSLENAKSSMCTWDERFLGLKPEPVLQILLAANFLGINPLMEHTKLYFTELIEQRNNVEPLSLELNSSDIYNVEEQFTDF